MLFRVVEMANQLEMKSLRAFRRPPDGANDENLAKPSVETARGEAQSAGGARRRPHAPLTVPERNSRRQRGGTGSPSTL